MRPVTATIIVGHVMDALKTLPDESVHCVVTSPPYWGLRDYKLEPQVWGGDPTHAHSFAIEEIVAEVGAGNWTQAENGPGLSSGRPQTRFRGDFRAARENTEFVIVRRGFCKCGAWLGSLGLEPTPDLYVQHIVEVFMEVRRVLRKDGTLWLNMGDGYASGEIGRHDQKGGKRADYADGFANKGFGEQRQQVKFMTGLKSKDLLGMPWRVAFALQADGWWLRSDIIWAKPNPMPESVTDRPTKAHEYLFLLAKSANYFYDADAIREPHTLESIKRMKSPHNGFRDRFDVDNLQTSNFNEYLGRETGWGNENGRNRRTVWEIPTQPYPEAHFATFPEALVWPCIVAGCPDGGTVLDPFVGSGTTLMVAAKNGRNAIGIELQEKYVPLIHRRLAGLEMDLIHPVKVEVLRCSGSSNAP